jgi:hypothetical protein
VWCASFSKVSNAKSTTSVSWTGLDVLAELSCPPVTNPGPARLAEAKCLSEGRFQKGPPGHGKGSVPDFLAFSLANWRTARSARCSNPPAILYIMRFASAIFRSAAMARASSAQECQCAASLDGSVMVTHVLSCFFVEEIASQPKRGADGDDRWKTKKDCS